MSQVEIFTFGAFRFDVTKAEQLIEKYQADSSKIELVSIDLTQLASLSGLIRRDRDHLQLCDVERPGIAVKTEFGVLPIDGWHRAQRRRDLDETSMSFYLIKDKTLVDEISLHQPQKSKKKLTLRTQ